MLRNVFAAVLCALLSTAIAAAELTEAQIQAFIEEIDQASNANDFNKLASMISDDAQTTMHIEVMGQTKSQTFPSLEYLKNAQLAYEQGMDEHMESQLTRQNTQIRIAENVATVTSDLSVTTTMEDHSMSMSTQEEMTIEQINGQLKITKSVGYMRM